MSIEEKSARIKHVAKFLGADLVGITEYDERWVYTKSVNVSTEEREEKPNDIPEGLTSVIVLGHEMDHELVKSYPSALAASATGREYSREAAIVSSLASFIHGLGYKAVGSSNDTGLTIPYAIKAGMGEYGRNQLVITEEFGPRVRFPKVYTDLPLLHDKPKRFGVHEFCSICNKCADACPPNALPKGPPQEGGPNRSSIQSIKKWTSNAEKCFGYWTKLRADCAICMRVCPYNKDFSGWRACVSPPDGDEFTPFGVEARRPLRLRQAPRAERVVATRQRRLATFRALMRQNPSPNPLPRGEGLFRA